MLLIRKLATFSHLEKFTDSKQPFDNNECDKEFERDNNDLFFYTSLDNFTSFSQQSKFRLFLWLLQLKLQQKSKIIKVEIEIKKMNKNLRVLP